MMDVYDWEDHKNRKRTEEKECKGGLRGKECQEWRNDDMNGGTWGNDRLA